MPYINNLRELRIRANQAIKLNVGGIWYFVTIQGKLIKQLSKEAIIMSLQEVNDFVINACDKSVYSVEKQLTEGYLTLEDGCRIGVCGTVSRDEKGNVLCFSKYTSLCVRVAHSVACSELVISDNLLNSNILIMGKPSAGKTTFLRDLAVRASNIFNVVVVDERGELNGCCGANLDNADVLLFADKNYAFSVAVRSLSPDIVAMDELQPSDFIPLKTVMESGVKVFATLHGSKIADIERLSIAGIKFDYCVLLEGQSSNLAKLYSQNEVSKLL